MSKSELGALYVAVVAIGMSMLLLEVVAFRLAAAVVGPAFAAFVAFWLPGSAALGAALLTRKATGSRARRAAHLSGIAGAATVSGTIALSWVSQFVATGEAGALHGAMALLGWLVPAFFAGGALADCIGLGITRVGRFGWLEAFGAAAISLILALLLEVLGAPRLGLAAALPLASAAIALAYLGRRARPSWGFITTLPLGIVALFAGDVGSPWLKMRTDIGRRTEINYNLWTPQGLIALRNPERRASLTIDKSAEMTMPQDLQSKSATVFAIQDLAYAVNETKKGPALVIGSAGGRELGLALAHGHDPVDMIGLHPSLVNQILSVSYAKATRYVMADPRVRARIGDGRAAVDELPTAHYQRVMVLGEGRFVQTGPRLLMQHDRLFTLEAVRAYFERLLPGGTLLLQVPRESTPGLFATLAAAFGDEESRKRLMACTRKSEWTAVVLHSLPLTKGEQRELARRCRRNRMTVEYPPESNNDSAEWLWSGPIARDARPFLQQSGLHLAAFRALSPTPPPKDDTPLDEPEQGTVAAAAAIVLAVLLVFLAVTGLSRPRGARLVELSVAPFGLALALCSFALIDGLLDVLGDPAYAWPLLVPLGLVGVGTGRLWIDVLPESRSRALLRPSLWVGCAWLVIVTAMVMFLFDVIAGRALLGLALTMPLLLITGAVLGGPLFTVLRMRGTAAVGSGLALHHAGWALGGALAVVVAELVGSSWVMVVGTICFGAAAVLMIVGARSTSQPGASVE